MSKSIKSERLGFRVSPELKKALMELAKADKRSLSAYIEIVLEQHVKANQSMRNNSSKRD